MDHTTTPAQARALFVECCRAHGVECTPAMIAAFNNAVTPLFIERDEARAAERRPSEKR